MAGKIYAQKGQQKTVFTSMVWKHMGKNKNGWTQISEEAYKGKASGTSDTKPTSLGQEEEYRKVYGQAKGLEKDGKLEDALAKYEKALSIKSSPTLKGKITKVKNAIEKSKSRKELVDNAEQLILEADYETALELLENAQTIENLEETAKRIEEIKAEMAEDSENDLTE